MSLSKIRMGLLVKGKVTGIYGFIVGISQNVQEKPEPIFIIEWQDGNKGGMHESGFEIISGDNV